MAYREIWHEMIINTSPSELYQALTDVKTGPYSVRSPHMTLSQVENRHC
jgi:hypothetical protein